jgi:hypothetical protein
MSKTTKRIIHMLATLTFIGLGVVGFIRLSVRVLSDRCVRSSWCPR